MFFTTAIAGWLLAASSVSASPSTSSLKWHWLNNPGVKAVSPVGRSTTIQVSPDTDLWRPTIALNNFTAPYLYTTIATANFQSVQVTVTAPWKTLYDQGGLVLSFPNSANPKATRFVKAGIEFNDGAPQLGVVATDILSDWSLSPITEAYTGNAKVTLLVERDGTDAWVYVLENQGTTRRALRQVTWAFNEDDVQGLAKVLEVGIYGAKPTEESGAGHAKDKIAVTFTGFSLITV
jgi:regulation of enolase protein 1 (concanavalin A-like superfamily)